MSENKGIEVRVVSASGVCGSGFREESLEEAIGRKPHFIGCDGGSTDPGPYPLGAGTTSFPRVSIKRDLQLMLLGARKAGVPLLIGSAGTAGGMPHVAAVKEVVEEIAAEENLKFPMAVINAEQDKDYLKQKFRDGRIKPLDPAPDFDEAVIDRSERIVGMMGEEPFMKALDNGAEVVIAGRASDCAIFAGIPIRNGIPAGVAWHAAKILECGAASVEQRKSPDCIMATCGSDNFVVEPLDPDLRCTPQSIAAHSLYENADPYHLVESNGTIDLTNSDYEALDNRRVIVRGSDFIPAKTYTVKLEGSEKVGYQSVIIGSIRDPFIIRQIDDWVERLHDRVHTRVKEVYGGAISADDYIFNVRIYGKNGTMGPLEPVKEITSHELCLLFEVTAPDQETASAIAAVTRHQALHLPIPEWSGLITGVACPYNPSYLERGAVYRFCVNHVVEPDDPYEMFPIDYVNVH
jgi:rRNA processing protein Gar1